MIKLRWSLGLMVVCATLALAAFAAAKEQAKPNGNEPAKPKWTGTIRVEGKHTQSALKQMVKITAQDATRTALAAVSGVSGDKTVKETELEVEHGFLVYCVDVRVKGQKGEHEVLVDAGSGKVLAQKLEDDDDDDGPDGPDEPDDDD